MYNVILGLLPQIFLSLSLSLSLSHTHTPTHTHTLAHFRDLEKQPLTILEYVEKRESLFFMLLFKCIISSRVSLLYCVVIISWATPTANTPQELLRKCVLWSPFNMRCHAESRVPLGNGKPYLLQVPIGTPPLFIHICTVVSIGVWPLASASSSSKCRMALNASLGNLGVHSLLFVSGPDSWTARRSKQSILKEISPEYSLEGLMLKLKLQ